MFHFDIYQCPTDGTGLSGEVCGSIFFIAVYQSFSPTLFSIFVLPINFKLFVYLHDNAFHP